MWLIAEFGITYVKPMLDFDVIYNTMPGFSQTGAGVLGLRVASASQVMFAVAPSVELGQTIIWDNGQAMRPYIRAGATLLSTGSWTINSNFEGAPAGVASFASANSIPRTLAKTSAGIDVFGLWGVSGLDLKLQYETQFANGYQAPKNGVDQADPFSTRCLAARADQRSDDRRLSCRLAVFWARPCAGA